MSVFTAISVYLVVSLSCILVFVFITRGGNSATCVGLNTSGISAGISFLAPKWSKRSIVLHAVAMIIIWLPVIIAFSPGTMNWDTYYQIFQFYPDHGPLLQIPWAPTESWIDCQFTDHHPLFDTLIFGFFAYSSDLFTGSWNAGLFLYTILQCSFTVLAFSLACGYLERFSMPAKGRLFVYLFYCFFPVYAAYGITMIKDSLFSAVFLLYFLATVEVVSTKGACLKSNRLLLAFVILSLLCCLTKKTGYYIVLVNSIAMLVLYRKHWHRYALVTVAPILTMSLILPLFVFPALNVAQGGKQEALGALFQQTARVAVKCTDESREERDAIDAVLPYASLKKLYDKRSADAVKNSYRWNTATNNDLVRYFKTWLAQGFRHPDEYAKATAYVVAPFFDVYEPISLHYGQGVEVDAYAKSSFFAPFEGARGQLKLMYKTITSIPLVRVLFSNVLYCWFLPIVCLLSLVLVLKKCGRLRMLKNACLARVIELLPLFAVIGLSIVAYLIAPVMQSRYALPLDYLSPFFICFTYSIAKNSNTLTNCK